MNLRKKIRSSKLTWYVTAQIGVLMFPFGLCLLGESITRRINGEPWFWWGTISLAVINAGLGLMIESGLIGGYPGNNTDDSEADA